MWSLEVDLVDVLALEGVADRVPGPQVQRRRHLAELEVEVDDARPASRCSGCRKYAEVGGEERLAAPAGGGRDGEHRCRGSPPAPSVWTAPAPARWAGCGSWRWPARRRRTGSLSATGSWSRSMAPVRMISRRVASGRLAKARTSAVAGVSSWMAWRADEPGLGAEARPGDEDVERPVGVDGLLDVRRAVAGHDLRPGAQLGSHTPDLVGQALVLVQNEDSWDYARLLLLDSSGAAIRTAAGRRRCWSQVWHRPPGRPWRPARSTGTRTCSGR